MLRYSPQDVRHALLEEVAAAQPKSPMDGTLQQNAVLSRVSQRLAIVNDIELEQLVLAEWYALFSTGYLSWGHNLNNASPPFCHVTARGKGALTSLSQDPSNPKGYMAYLNSLAPLNPVASSYLSEALDCYVGGHHKASAVMTGAAAESLVLELRDRLSQRLHTLGQTVPPKLGDWRIKTVLDELQHIVEGKKSTLQHGLREEFYAYWSAFTQQIRAARNDAGHPSSVDPVSPEAAHASLLVFPLLARLAYRLNDWATNQLK
jgi:hypothetical protein